MKIVDNAKSINKNLPLQEKYELLGHTTKVVCQKVPEAPGCKQCGGAGFCEYKAGGVRNVTILNNEKV